jgi:hypothetical protein
MDAGLLAYEPRNQCQHCLWSRHVMFGCEDRPPCDGLMRPVARSARLVVQECEDCGFAWVSYDEDWWAALDARLQAGVINLAIAETARRNGSPVVIYQVRREYRVPVIAIPGDLLGARPLVAARPRTAAVSGMVS